MKKLAPHLGVGIFVLALFYPQLHRGLEFWPAWHLGLLGQMLLAGCGMVLFLSSQGYGRATQLIGGIAYAANSHFVTHLYFRAALGAFCARRRGNGGNWCRWPAWRCGAGRRGGGQGASR